MSWAAAGCTSPRSAWARRRSWATPGSWHAGRRVPKRSLIAVLSATPKKMKAGTSWIGSPPHMLRRTTVEGESDLTYRPTLKLKMLRAGWELTRALAVFTTVGIAGGVLWTLSALTTYFSPLAAILLSGAVLVAAGAIAALVAVAAKWLVIEVIRPGEHALWSSFIWRTEMVDSFTELVCAQWFARLASGTPALVWFLRAQGARIGHGVWCESYWFPEADLGDFGRPCHGEPRLRLQTHLFHDRIMSIDAVTLGAGATLGPHSVILPAAPDLRKAPPPDLPAWCCAARCCQPIPTGGAIRRYAGTSKKSPNPNCQLTNKPEESPPMPHTILDEYTKHHGSPKYTVEHYDLALVIKLASNLLDGRATLRIRALEESPRSGAEPQHGLKIIKATCQGRKVQVSKKHHRMVVSLPTPVPAGERVELNAALCRQPAS